MAEVCVDQEVQGIELRSFVSLCLKETFKGSVEKTDWLVLAIGGVLGLLAFLVPAWERTVTKALFLLPLTAFASVGIFRLCLSPLLVYRKKERASRLTENELRQTIRQQDESIRVQSEKTKRTPAEQHNYYKVKKCLESFGDKAAISLRHLRARGSISIASPGMGNSGSFIPPDITVSELNWALGACAGEGVVIVNEPFGKNERIYEIAKNMDKALDELLY
jgi:uncharacterized protein YjeT (DUF2065 family)